MKKFITVLFSFFLLTNVCISQSGWYWQNPNPSYSSYYDIKFANSMTGCAVGSNGTIIRTTDKGISWKIVKESFYTSDTLFSICFVNQSTGFAVGRKVIDGVIYKTTNTGANWTEYNTNMLTSLQSVYFANENTGYTVGKYSVIFKTTNSGITWDTVQHGTQGNYLSVFFVNSNTGFIGSNGFMLKTTNAGLNWSNVNINLSSQNVNSIYFTDQNTGFVSYGWYAPPSNSGTCVFRTTNCGMSWSIENINGSYSGGFIKFLNVTTGYICGYYEFLKTTNSGVNWFSIPISRDYVNSVDLANDSVVFAVGQYGNIFKGNIITDNFTNVSSLSEHHNHSIIFVNQNIGYIAGYDGILKTTNWGVNWQKLSSPYTDYTDISFSDSNNGYACTFHGQVIKTTNGGMSWEILSYVNSHGILSVSALNKDTVFCLPLNGNIVDRTINGGINWTSIEIANWQVNLYSICFINSRTGYIARLENNLIAKSTNTGENWQAIALDVNATPRRFKKLDSLTIYASSFWTGCSSGVIMSTNGGINWIRHPVSSEYGGDVDFINANTGYLITTGNYNSTSDRIWMTEDGGLNWVQQLLPFQDINYLNKVKFINEQTGFIIGYCLILKTTNGGIPIGIKTDYSEVPSSFSLSQNYPNPFNPVTMIKYDIPPSKGARGMMVQLIIYDVLGREIETLVNEAQKPGSYEVTWDGSRYASGVYFYKLITEEFTETKKMVLIK